MYLQKLKIWEKTQFSESFSLIYTGGNWEFRGGNLGACKNNCTTKGREEMRFCTFMKNLICHVASPHSLQHLHYRGENGLPVRMRSWRPLPYCAPRPDVSAPRRRTSFSFHSRTLAVRSSDVKTSVAVGRIHATLQPLKWKRVFVHKNNYCKIDKSFTRDHQQSIIKRKLIH